MTKSNTPAKGTKSTKGTTPAAPAAPAADAKSKDEGSPALLAAYETKSAAFASADTKASDALQSAEWNRVLATVRAHAAFGKWIVSDVLPAMTGKRFGGSESGTKVREAFRTPGSGVFLGAAAIADEAFRGGSVLDRDIWAHRYFTMDRFAQVRDAEWTDAKGTTHTTKPRIDDVLLAMRWLAGAETGGNVDESAKRAGVVVRLSPGRNNGNAGNTRGKGTTPAAPADDTARRYAQDATVHAAVMASAKFTYAKVADEDLADAFVALVSRMALAGVALPTLAAVESETADEDETADIS